jgi:ABC-2 type transport system permease protein
MISIKKINALFAKDMKTIFHNLFVLSGLMIMPIMALLLKIGLESPEEVIALAGFLIPMNILMNGANIICVMIAEEKEKYTLNVLVSSTVSSADFLISKVLLTTVLTFISNAVLYFILGLQASMPLFPFLLVTGVTILPVAAVGAIIGIACKTQAAASTVVAPVTLIMVFLPLFLGGNNGNGNFFIDNILYYTFSEQMTHGLSAVYHGEAFIRHIGAIALNFVVLAALFGLFYKKKGLAG